MRLPSVIRLWLFVGATSASKGRTCAWEAVRSAGSSCAGVTRQAAFCGARSRGTGFLGEKLEHRGRTGDVQLGNLSPLQLSTTYRHTAFTEGIENHPVFAVWPRMESQRNHACDLGPEAILRSFQDSSQVWFARSHPTRCASPRLQVVTYLTKMIGPAVLVESHGSCYFSNPTGLLNAITG